MVQYARHRCRRETEVRGESLQPFNAAGVRRRVLAICFCAFDACSFRSSLRIHRGVEGPAMNELTMQPHRTVRMPIFGHACEASVNLESFSRFSWAANQPRHRPRRVQSDPFCSWPLDSRISQMVTIITVAQPFVQRCTNDCAQSKRAPPPAVANSPGPQASPRAESTSRRMHEL
jgi:hypothetical protein